MPEAESIRTERLLLRGIDSEGDAADVLEWYRLDSTSLYSTQPSRHTTAEVSSFLATHFSGPRSLSYAVVLPNPRDASDKPNRVIGVLGCHVWPEIGYTFHPAHHGHGYASEALRAYLQQLWRVMPPATRPAQHYVTDGKDMLTSDTCEDGYDYVLGLCDVENVASQRVLERIGFVKGEIIKNEYESRFLGIRDSMPMLLARPGKQLPQDWINAPPEIRDLED